MVGKSLDDSGEMRIPLSQIDEKYRLVTVPFGDKNSIYLLEGEQISDVVLRRKSISSVYEVVEKSKRGNNVEVNLRKITDRPSLRIIERKIVLDNEDSHSLKAGEGIVGEPLNDYGFSVVGNAWISEQYSAGLTPSEVSEFSKLFSKRK